MLITEQYISGILGCWKEHLTDAIPDAMPNPDEKDL